MGSSMVKAQMVLTPGYQAMLISRSQSILATVRRWHGGGFVHGRLSASRTEMGSFMVGGGFIQHPQKWPVMVSLYTSEKSTDEGRTQQRWFLLSRFQEMDLILQQQKGKGYSLLREALLHRPPQPATLGATSNIRPSLVRYGLWIGEKVIESQELVLVVLDELYAVDVSDRRIDSGKPSPTAAQHGAAQHNPRLPRNPIPALMASPCH
ncbi:hypothetical protein RHMOL_Rhmol09G0131200 [Rhododendron molle]|uniref:Uncharacterized protein n=1 Tax=Rhododendron molle TaxID=49168 RepID=A0ACC0MDX0_RHOML|nr:hypothetical protein RHMOL_Rhmol09G0131200 [Rhododendron molle]